MTKEEGAVVRCATAAMSVEDAKRPTVVPERPGDGNVTLLVLHTTC